MIPVPRAWSCLLGTIACLGGFGCQLHRPATTLTRTIEPQMLEPQLAEPAKLVPKAPNAMSIRLLETQARGHIGRHLLHQQADGELTEDPVWRWSSAPDRYLDTALRLEVASNPNLRLVDVSHTTVLAATLLVWNLESVGERRLVGAVEFQITGTDRVVRTKMARASQPVSAELPGDLAAVAGRLLHRLASEGLKSLSVDSE